MSAAAEGIKHNQSYDTRAQRLAAEAFSKCKLSASVKCELSPTSAVIKASFLFLRLKKEVEKGFLRTVVTLCSHA